MRLPIVESPVPDPVALSVVVSLRFVMSLRFMFPGVAELFMPVPMFDEPVPAPMFDEPVAVFGAAMPGVADPVPVFDEPVLGGVMVPPVAGVRLRIVPDGVVVPLFGPADGGLLLGEPEAPPPAPWATARPVPQVKAAAAARARILDACFIR